MTPDQELGDLDAFFRRLESDPESIDAQALVSAFQAIRRWMTISSLRLRLLEERMEELEAARRRSEERMAQLEAAMEELQRRYEETEALLRQVLVRNLWWDLARGAISLFSSN